MTSSVKWTTTPSYRSSQFLDINPHLLHCGTQASNEAAAKIIILPKTSGYTLRGSRSGVQSASLYHNFRKPGNYVIMTSLMTS